jgi:hypothetical protein
LILSIFRLGTGIGIWFAPRLRDAERMAEAVIGAGEDPAQLDAALAAAGRDRDRRLRQIFDGTALLADLAPLGRARRAVLTAVAEDPDRRDAFVAAFSGVAPWQDAFTAPGAVRALGPSGTLTAIRRSADPPIRRSARPEPEPEPEPGGHRITEARGTRGWWRWARASR